MDKALETTYTMRDTTRVVRTEAAGSAERTAKQHMRACKTAVAELHKASRDAWVVELDAEIARLNLSVYEDPHYEQRAVLRARRTRVAGNSFAITPPNLTTWYKPAPYKRTYSDAELDTFRTK